MQTTEKDNLLQEMLEKNFIYSLVLGENFRWEHKALREELNLGPYGCVLMVVARGEGRLTEKRLMENTEKVSHTIAETFFGNGWPTLVGPYTMGRIGMYIDFGSQIPTNEERQRLRELCCEAMHFANMDRRVGVEVGIGGTYPIESAHDSYIEALDCVGYMAEDGVILYEQCKKQRVSKVRYRELKEELLENVGRGKMEAILRFREMLDILESLSLVTRKNKVLEIIVLASKEVQFADYSEADFMDYVAYAKEIDAMDWDALKTRAEQQINYFVKIVRFSKQMVRSELVSQTIQFMEEHYSEQISLQKVAYELGVTPQHLSKLFKKETGKNYIDWLTDLRLEKAKEYLVAGKVSIREVGYLVGIQDPNYFSRLFKKNVGVSPSEYLKGY